MVDGVNGHIEKLIKKVNEPRSAARQLPMPLFSVPLQHFHALAKQGRAPMIQPYGDLLRMKPNPDATPNEEDNINRGSEQLSEDARRSGDVDEANKLNDKIIFINEQAHENIDRLTAKDWHIGLYGQEMKGAFIGAVSIAKQMEVAKIAAVADPSDGVPDDLMAYEMSASSPAISFYTDGKDKYIIFLEANVSLQKINEDGSKGTKDNSDTCIATVYRYIPELDCYILDRMLASNKFPEALLENLADGESSLDYDLAKNTFDKHTCTQSIKVKQVLRAHKKTNKIDTPLLILLERIGEVFKDDPDFSVGGLDELLAAAENNKLDDKAFLECLSDITASLASRHDQNTKASYILFAFMLLTLTLITATVLLGIDLYSDPGITGCDYDGFNAGEKASAIALLGIGGTVTTGYSFAVAPKHKNATDALLKSAREAHESVTNAETKELDKPSK